MALDPSTPEPPPPTPGRLAELERFRAAQPSVDAVRTSASSWQKGLAALVTLELTAVFVKGPDQTSTLEPTWRAWTVGLLLAGIAAALIGLWLALTVSGGRLEEADFEKLLDTYVTYEGFEVAVLKDAARRLRCARRAVAVSLTLLFVGIGCWLLAPPAAGVLTVETKAGVACGWLQGVAGGEVTLTTSGGPKSVPLADITGLQVKEKCS